MWNLKQNLEIFLVYKLSKQDRITYGTRTMFSRLKKNNETDDACWKTINVMKHPLKQGICKVLNLL